MSVGVDSFEGWFLYKWPMSLPTVENSTKNQKNDKREEMKNMSKSKNVKRLILMNVQFFWWDPTMKDIKPEECVKHDFYGYLKFFFL